MKQKYLDRTEIYCAMNSDKIRTNDIELSIAEFW